MEFSRWSYFKTRTHLKRTGYLCVQPISPFSPSVLPRVVNTLSWFSIVTRCFTRRYNITEITSIVAVQTNSRLRKTQDAVTCIQLSRLLYHFLVCRPAGKLDAFSGTCLSPQSVCALYTRCKFTLRPLATRLLWYNRTDPVELSNTGVARETDRSSQQRNIGLGKFQEKQQRFLASAVHRLKCVYCDRGPWRLAQRDSKLGGTFT